MPLKLKPFFFGEEPLKEGDTVAVQCVILSGDLPASMAWILNGNLLHSNDNVGITKSGSKIISLTIESVSANDAGNYTCVGENNVGVVTYTSTLLINGWFGNLFLTRHFFVRWYGFIRLFNCLEFVLKVFFTFNCFFSCTFPYYLMRHIFPHWKLKEIVFILYRA